jgi:hypothetical protein
MTRTCLDRRELPMERTVRALVGTRLHLKPKSPA